MRRYAQNTKVTSDKSRAEIEHLLTNYGADQFLYGWDGDAAVIGFRHKNRSIRFHLPSANREDYRKTAGRVTRTEVQLDAVMAKERKRRWRALALAIKAKLEACATGIATFEDEFLAYTVLPNGQTMSQWVSPQLKEAYENGKMPVGLLPAWKGK